MSDRHIHIFYMGGLASASRCGQLNDISVENAMMNTRKALGAGVLKILSKIGISLLSSYHGAQIFEAIGLGKELIDTAFVGTPSRIGGLSFRDVAEEIAQWHASAGLVASGETSKLVNYGFVKYYQKLEHHGWNPPMTRELHSSRRR